MYWAGNKGGEAGLAYLAGPRLGCFQRKFFEPTSKCNDSMRDSTKRNGAKLPRQLLKELNISGIIPPIQYPIQVTKADYDR